MAFLANYRQNMDSNFFFLEGQIDSQSGLGGSGKILVKNKIAQRIKNWTILIYFHFLRHMGMMTDNHIRARFNQFTRQLTLAGVLNFFVFRAPMGIDDHEISLFFPRFGNQSRYLLYLHRSIGIIETNKTKIKIPNFFNQQ